MIAMAALAVTLALAQTPPEFNVASIKVVAYGPGKVDMVNASGAFPGYECATAADVDGDGGCDGGTVSSANCGALVNSTGCIATDEAMLESLWQSTNPTAFVHAHILVEQYNSSVAIPSSYDGPLDTLGSSRLMPAAGESRCGAEYCPKGPCVMLEMNYFGSVAAQRAIETMESTDDNVVTQWNVVRGRTYCGPVAGVAPPYKASNMSDHIVHDFPQERPVPSRYTPAAFAGMVLPLARPSKFPSWYFADGYWGWRQNGRLKTAGIPCYGRHIPRWMLPNTCIESDQACINGFSNRRTAGNAPQWPHTLVDPFSMGMQGVFYNSTDNATFSARPYKVSSPHSEHFRDSPSLLLKALDLKASPFVDAQAAAYFFHPFYSLPDAGLHGFSEWRSDWISEPSIESTQARFPVPASASNWIERTFSATANSEVSLDIVFDANDVPATTEESRPSPQQMRAMPLPTTPPSIAPGPVRGNMHSQRRLEKFTPQGMVSERAYDLEGVRVFMHPLFEYMGGGAPTADYFFCSTGVLDVAGTNCVYQVFDGYFNLADDAGSTKPANYPEYIRPFGASFINIEQAMRRYHVHGPPAPPPPSNQDKTDILARLNVCNARGVVDSKGDPAKCCTLSMPDDADDACAVNWFMPSGSIDMDARIRERRRVYNATMDATTSLLSDLACLNTFLTKIDKSNYKDECDNAVDSGLCKCREGKHAWLKPSGFFKKHTCNSDCAIYVLSTDEVHSLVQFVSDPLLGVVSGASDPDGNATTVCPQKCDYTSTTGFREVCASQCWTQWMKYLIPPVDVSRSYAAKWNPSDNSGLGGSTSKRTQTETTWWDAACDPSGTGDQLGWDSIPSVCTLRLKHEVRVNFIADVWALNRSFLSMDGRFNDYTRTQKAKANGKALRDVGIIFGGPLFDVFDALDPHALAHSTSGALQSHKADETGVDEQLCDLAVCDIASSKEHNRNEISSPIRCVPRGYAYANFGRKSGDTNLQWSAPFAGVVPGTPDGDAADNDDAANGASSWYSAFRPNRGSSYLIAWRERAFVQPGDDVSETSTSQYNFEISVPKGADKSWHSTPADYSKAVPASFGVNLTEFTPTPKDAGYSQRLHDDNAYACTCGEQGGLEMYTKLLQTQADINRFNVEQNVFSYSSTVHALVEISISWLAANSEVTALSGLYMAGTRGKTEWVERDVLDRENNPLPPTTNAGQDGTYDRFLKPHAPDADTATAMVYTREPQNRETSATTPHGLRQNDHVKEYLAVTSSSCVRFPIGVLHRSQMSPTVREHLYGNTTNEHVVTDFTLKTNAETGFAPTMQGYCEPIIVDPAKPGLYRFCPNAPHKTADARTKFCDPQANPLASHFLIGVRIDYRPLDRRCSIKHMVCVLVPGSAGDSASRTNFVQGDPSEGLIKAHTTADFAGYTILVTPFNRTTFQAVLTHRVKVPMVISDYDEYMGYLLKDPLKVDANDTVVVQPVDSSDQSLTGFGEYREFFNMMSDLSGYLSARSNLTANATQDDAVAVIQRVIDTAIDTVFAGAPSSDVNLTRRIAPTIVCPKYTDAPANIEFDPSNLDASRATYIVPNPDQMGGVAKRCIFGAQLFPPNPESGIVVTGAGITVASASTVYPLRFGGEAVGASTCSRFAVAAREFTLTASFNQSGCRQRIDAFLRTPVQFMGTDVDHGNVAITTTGNHSVAVSVLGKDSEFFPVPTNLSAQNLRINVTYSNATPRAPGSFDAAFARVHGDSEITVVSQDGGGGDATAPARVRVLLQGIASNDTSAPHKHSAMLTLVGNGAKCVDGTLTDAADDTLGADCEFVNVTEFTSLFGYRFEHRLFRTHVRSTILAWVLLVIFLVVAGVSGVYILVAPAAA